LISHEEEKGMLAAHALGALDADEARMVEEHLQACAECRAEMDEWRETAGALAYGVGAAEPSSGLRSRILESVRAEGALPKAKRKGGLKLAVPEVSKATDSSSKVTAMPRRAWTGAHTFSAIAASLALIALATSIFLMWRLRVNERELARYHTAVEVLAKQAAGERAARELLTSPQSESALLAGTNMAPGARAHLAFDRGTGHAMLFAYGLPPAPAGKAYQLWFISGGKVMPGKVFTPDTRGQAMINEEVPVTSLDKAPVFAVTLEPSGGVQAPTGEKYLLSTAS
jgi:anti-sigma-K factor RskA